MSTTEVRAGRELDARIAIEVMGWQRGRTYGNGNGEWIFPEGTRAHFRKDWDGTPQYSTDIAAAWLVVEKMRERGYYMNLHVPGPRPCFDLGLYQAEFHDALVVFEGHREPGIAQRVDAAPLAICLAALQAVGHAPEDQ